MVVLAGLELQCRAVVPLATLFTGDEGIAMMLYGLEGMVSQPLVGSLERKIPTKYSHCLL